MTQHRMTSDQRIAAGQHTVDDIRAVTAGVSRGENRHRLTRQPGGRFGGQRLGGRNAVAGQAAAAKQVNTPDRHTGPPAAQRNIENRGILPVFPLGVTYLLGVAVHRRAVLTSKPDCRAQVVDVRVGEHDGAHVTRCVAQFVQRGQHLRTVAGIAGVDQQHAGVVGD
ncbi:Uncharacterised protein [Mycobacterium tuberculosis]|uniref:Uncharacterized protein n=1 Tax=Mycobacterium tuberculosis TaxID=1773 RepID=A0A0T9CE61_MYCTX|nr:Uncharacterised protein [Mycobacterium tuberculosis]COW10129.1 Uncharacterised protein [Mycobacterium tuberculosis]